MSLKEDLEALKARSATRMKPEVREMMHQSVEKLRASGAVERALKVGDKAPSFALANSNGETVSSHTLLAKGPLVISFNRGKW